MTYLRIPTTGLTANHTMLLDEHHLCAINLLQPSRDRQTHGSCADYSVREICAIRRRGGKATPPASQTRCHSSR